MLAKPAYTAADRRTIVAVLKVLELEKSDDSQWAVLRQNKGKLLKRSKGQITIVAKGCNDWNGCVELKEETVGDTATAMTARVIKDVAADILAVEEVEDLDTLRTFNGHFLRSMNAEYDHVMSVRGNDQRRIDVAILTRKGKAIETIVSHADDGDGSKRIFSRDSPEYTVSAGGETILMLINHLKSQGYGSKEENDAKRKSQAQRVREIYDQRRAEGFENIVVAARRWRPARASPIMRGHKWRVRSSGRSSTRRASTSSSPRRRRRAISSRRSSAPST